MSQILNKKKENLGCKNGQSDGTRIDRKTG